MNPMSQSKTSEQLRRAWVEHPHFRYRGCAPDPDDPLRMVGDPGLHVGAHHGPDAFAPEGQKERRAREERAIEVCLNCPVMVQCDRYASSVTPDGRLAEPEGVWGGRRSLERHKALIQARVAVTAAPDSAFQTEQKQAVLAALARCWEPLAVAAAAGMDVRTANWQRSQLVRLLGLPKTVSRMRVLAAARERGLLDGVRVMPDDGTVPALAPPTKLPAPAQAPAAGGVVVQMRRPRRSHAAMPGQLSFESLVPTTSGVAA
ncbi:WhiB family transcriptional regulator (plasmid) [Streptomyces sp. NEAU-sy36]|uniref:WhiB family transcriptional regulator n=1 Tax=unclassified Streptomyces TaxID=2593676 RepID=UPI0015D59721|nr:MULTISPECIES: WhiB family transcriptional regulator [unclassified Streptomyces]QLJ06772.1 WhiB family transcriptional regulator [Streptomyces sp. NEAU-sy36]